ncbi:hypothetical protein NDU88_005299 [Pleurodeles waltl]|uniref:Uncharacterized protein n=1 Tax=Pleurodeles waltl TaxID=8319 RepID=A0AAV7NPY7_PLEWA|nr:hypothetical protein NDU88_005299 [Pleurodeles waltl]
MDHGRALSRMLSERCGSRPDRIGPSHFGPRHGPIHRSWAHAWGTHIAVLRHRALFMFSPPSGGSPESANHRCLHGASSDLHRLKARALLVVRIRLLTPAALSAGYSLWKGRLLTGTPSSASYFII